jgi:6-phosphogluconolactonase
MLTGTDKQKVLKKALKDGAASSLPVGRLLADLEMDIDIHWCA